MANINGALSKVNIPCLDEKNFLHWLMRIKAHLRHKGLIKYILEPPTALAGAAADAVAKKHAKTVDILMNYMSKTAFKAVGTPNNKDSPHGIWTQIISLYALTSVNNKGRVWLKFMRYEFKGDLKGFINDMHKMLTKIALVKLGVPNNILSFSILAKLSEDLWNVVDNIILNKVIVESPAATLTKLQEIVHLQESRKTTSTKMSSSQAKSTKEQSESASALMNESKKGKKKCRKDGPKCKPGKHNPAVTSHWPEFCWQVFPHLYPNHPNNQSKGKKPAETQLVEVSDGHKSEALLLMMESVDKPVVLDTGATHHMVNNQSIFTTISKTNIKILTGGHSNYLAATAIGTATLVNQNGQEFKLANVLLVPDLS